MMFSKKLACIGALLTAAAMHAQSPAPPTVRIGITTPFYSNIYAAPQAAEALRMLEMQMLKSFNVDVIKSDALPSDCCDYFLTTTVNQVKASGRFGGLKGLSALRQMSPVIPGAGLAKAGAILQSAQLAANVASVAEGITAKSQVTLGYSLATRSGQQVLNGLETAKAKTDGEDVLTPMVQAAAAKIVAAAKH